MHRLARAPHRTDAGCGPAPPVGWYGNLKAPRLSAPLAAASGKQKARQTQVPPNYKVLLHNDAVNKREYVVQVLLKARVAPPAPPRQHALLSPQRAPPPAAQVVEGMTLERAYDIMSEAHEYGLALVLITVQEEAENICDSLRNNGLVATVEPDSGGRRGGGGDGGGS